MWGLCSFVWYVPLLQNLVASDWQIIESVFFTIAEPFKSSDFTWRGHSDFLVQLVHFISQQGQLLFLVCKVPRLALGPTQLPVG